MENVHQLNPVMTNSNIISTVDGRFTRVADRSRLTFVFLWLFTFVIYARPQDIFPAITPLHLPLVFGALAGMTCLAALTSGGMRLRWPRELTLMLLLTLWFVLGVPFAYWRRGSFELLTQTWFKTAFIFLLLTQTLSSLGRIRKLLWAILLSELLATAASIILQAKMAIQNGTRMEGINEGMLGWNFLGIAAAITIPYMAVLYIYRSPAFRTAILLITLASMISMLMLTGSRSGFLALIFSMILTWWFILRRSFRGRVVGLILALSLIAATARAPEVFWLRLQTMWNSSATTTNATAASADESAKERTGLLERSIKYTFENPIFGVGVGNFVVINGNDLAQPEAWHGTHNMFTQISSEAGLPGLVLFLLLLGTVIGHAKDAISTSRESNAGTELNLMARATLISVISFGFGGFFAHLAYDYYFYFPAAIAVAVWTIARQNPDILLHSTESTGAQLATRRPTEWLWQ